MPTDLATNLRISACQLKHALVELDTAKTTTQRRHQRPTKPTFNPTPPGNTNPIHADLTIREELESWCRQLKDTTPTTTQPLPAPNTPTHHWADWITTHSDTLANDPDADTLITELNRWTTIAYRAIGTEPSTRDKEQRVTARTILHHLHKAGYNYSPSTLRGWAHKGHITSQHNHEGKATYLPSEVYRHIHNTLQKH